MEKRHAKSIASLLPVLTTPTRIVLTSPYAYAYRLGLFLLPTIPVYLRLSALVTTATPIGPTIVLTIRTPTPIDPITLSALLRRLPYLGRMGTAMVVTKVSVALAS
jgi:hypothetical protein